MRVTSVILALLLEATSEAHFLKRLLQKKATIPPREARTYKTPIDACCACFKRKYDWPSNGGTAATFAPRHTCDKCYVADRYGTAALVGATGVIPSPPFKAGANPSAPSDGPSDGPPVIGVGPPMGFGCTDMCDTLDSPTSCSLYEEDDATGEILQQENFFGANACKRLIEHPLGARFPAPICETVWGRICPVACEAHGCSGPKDKGAYEVIESKVEAVTEWNWNCADGDATENTGEWKAGPTVGEPAARGPFLQCMEDPGFYCSDELGDDMQLAAGGEKPDYLEDAAKDHSEVSLQVLPLIKGWNDK